MRRTPCVSVAVCSRGGLAHGLSWVLAGQSVLGCVNHSATAPNAEVVPVQGTTPAPATDCPRRQRDQVRATRAARARERLRRGGQRGGHLLGGLADRVGRGDPRGRQLAAPDQHLARDDDRRARACGRARATATSATTLPCSDCQSNRPSPVTTTSCVGDARSSRPDGVGDEDRAGHQPGTEQRQAEARARRPRPRRARRSAATSPTSARAPASRSGRSASPSAAVASVREVPERALEVLGLLRGRALLRREPGARAVQAEQRDVDVGRGDELDAAQPVAQLAQARQVVGGHRRRARRHRASSASAGPGEPERRARARRAHPRRRRSSPSRRARRRPGGHPRRAAAASSSPTPRLVVRRGVAAASAGDERQPDRLRRLDVGGRARRAGRTAGTGSPTGDVTVTGTSSPPSARVQRRDEARAAVGQRARGRPRRAAPPRARPPAMASAASAAVRLRAEAVRGDEHAHAVHRGTAEPTAAVARAVCEDRRVSVEHLLRAGSVGPPAAGPRRRPGLRARRRVRRRPARTERPRPRRARPRRARRARRPRVRAGPPLPARRGHRVRRRHGRLVQARARGRRPARGRVHRLLRRALHGRVRRHPHLRRTSR